MYLITKWFGTFLCDKKSIKKKKLFPNNEKAILDKLNKIQKNNILDEEIEISKNKKVFVCEKRLKKIGEYKPLDDFFKNFDILPEKFGYSNDFLQKITIKKTIESVEDDLSSKDFQIIQMVNSLEDLIQTSNLLYERLNCWEEINYSKEKIDPLIKSYDFVNNEIKNLEKIIQDDMIDIAPNISKVTGALIGAKLLSYSGGLKNLAMLPSSTIQVLGAEKALFRFKKEGGKPPKHGVIFQNSYINKSPYKIRGRIARVIASNISYAAKADAFTKRDISDLLINNMKSRIKDIRNL